MDGYLHPCLLSCEESLRRGRLQIRFGILGGYMALIYSCLFLLLDNLPGGIVLGVAGLIIPQVPWIVRKTGNLTVSGHLYSATLMLGIAAMCVIDGGRDSIMFAWLTAVPVTALLLLPLREALWWCAACVLTAVSFVCLGLTGVPLPQSDASYYNPALSSVSYLGLIFFLGFVALLFEKGRLEALARFEATSRKLAKANQKLIDLNHQKNEFLNIAAHDLKNPLSIICGYADLLREENGFTAAEVREQAGEILRSGNHMLDIICNVLDVRAIEDGRRNLNRELCSLHEIVDDIVSGYRKTAYRKHIQIINEVDEHSPDAWADPGATRQILDNLISNALKYTPHHGTVHLSAGSTETEVTVTVTNTGPGLSKQDQEKLWEKFTRLTPKPTGREHSTGLGLWIVRNLAIEMGGNAFCRSQEGEGSTFGVQLPLWTDSSFSTRAEGEDAGRAALQRFISGTGKKSPSEVVLPG